MLVAGLEPARSCPRQILSLMRLPFRHTSISNNRDISYHNIRSLASFYSRFPKSFCLKIKLIVNLKLVKRCEIILRRLGASDQLHAAVFF